jgi:hypothetical protein
VVAPLGRTKVKGPHQGRGRSRLRGGAVSALCCYQSSSVLPSKLTTFREYRQRNTPTVSAPLSLSQFLSRQFEQVS